MRWHLLNLILPVLGYSVVVVTGLFGKHESRGLAETLMSLPVNLLFVAVPYAAWFGISKVLNPSSAVVHFGYLGAHLALFAICALIYSAQSGHPGNAWLLYYPAAAVFIVVGGMLGYGVTWLTKGKRA